MQLKNIVQMAAQHYKLGNVRRAQNYETSYLILFRRYITH
jgi:hypothetical protein